jgi:uncharacterized protein
MSTSLLALLDDIASVLDDVAVLTKVAAKKTAGVLGDDLALNAQQVAGVDADRELPVVWAVGKGSLVNKAILVPAALAISTFVPMAVTPLLMAGGAFLCFEGVEKIAHKHVHAPPDDSTTQTTLAEKAVVNSASLEKSKIKGAIRTDLILSAEIIVISLGTVTAEPFGVRVGVLVGISLAMTIGVYGLVGVIVKLDDGGLFLSRSKGDSPWATFKRALGRSILRAAPYLMRGLSLAGTAAMFLVGGGILTHGLPSLETWAEAYIQTMPGAVATLAKMAFDAVVGILVGALVLRVVVGVKRIRGEAASAAKK